MIEFKIFAVVLMLAQNQFVTLVSKESYPDKVACEAAMPKRLNDIVEAYKEDGVEVEVGGKCDVPGIKS